VPIIGISIEKETAFRGSVQPFSNVYYYNNNIGSVPDEAGASALIDELTAFEKSIHSNLVTFTYGRCWHQTLTEIGTKMIAQKALSGNGGGATVGSFDKERAFLFRFRAGSDSRGNPVYLRKWYHICGGFGSQYSTVGTTVLENTAVIPSANRTAMEGKVADIATLDSGGGDWQLCAKSGRDSEVTTPTSHPYLEHRQLGDQWRGG
jgi:hypothetical protein